MGYYNRTAALETPQERLDVEYLLFSDVVDHVPAGAVHLLRNIVRVFVLDVRGKTAAEAGINALTASLSTVVVEAPTPSVTLRPSMSVPLILLTLPAELKMTTISARSIVVFVQCPSSVSGPGVQPIHPRALFEPARDRNLTWFGLGARAVEPSLRA